MSVPVWYLKNLGTGKVHKGPKFPHEDLPRIPEECHRPRIKRYKAGPEQPPGKECYHCFRGSGAA